MLSCPFSTSLWRVATFFGLQRFAIVANILKYPFVPFKPTEGGELRTSGLDPNVFCILTSVLNHYTTILDIKHCILLVNVSDVYDVWRRRRQRLLRHAARSCQWGWPTQRTLFRSVSCYILTYIFQEILCTYPIISGHNISQYILLTWSYPIISLHQIY